MIILNVGGISLWSVGNANCYVSMRVMKIIVDTNLVGVTLESENHILLVLVNVHTDSVVLFTCTVPHATSTCILCVEACVCSFWSNVKSAD